MKTFEKQYQKAGNIVMVQMETLKGEGFGFLTAAPAIDSGALEIRELRSEGAVNTLMAINHSAHYYLLTDMDLLKGAKQNRVVNTSVLIEPHSKQEVNVSCVERSRWSYNSPTFSAAPRILDTKMRAAKADSLKKDKKGMTAETQSKIWGLINEEMVSNNIINETEDYTSILESKSKEQEPEFKFLPGKKCNGLAVFEGKKLVSFDIFGNRKAYQYYFDLLAGNAINMVQLDAATEAIEKAEAFYRLDDYLDLFESELEPPVDSRNGNVGMLRWSGAQQYSGFELSFESQLVHLAGFNRE